MTKLDTNVAPYFDDFDSSKNYTKIMFRPGRPVQGRELNQIQSTLQNQIEKFANHIFKNGSKVSNARTSFKAVSYVRLIDNPDVSIYPTDTRLLGETSGITATLVKGINVENDDPATLYVVYTGTAIDGETSEFIPGENVKIIDENSLVVDTVTVRCPACPGSGLNDTVPPTGKGQMFTAEDGIFYFEGMFIETPAQSVLVSKYLAKDADGNVTNFVPCKVGLDFIQTIVTYEDDPSLLDPSLGYPNSTAPGADRYKVELRLVKRDYDAEDGENFIVLARIGEGMAIEFLKSDAEYANIMDEMARRTYETNGDYTIRPFRVSFLNAKKETISDPYGWALNGSDDDLVAVVSPSVAYVKGYRVETTYDTPVAFEKARDTMSLESFVKHFDGRTFIQAIPKGSGLWPNPNTDQGTISDARIAIYDAVTDGSTSAGAIIGSCRISDMEYVSGDLAAHQAIYKYYIYDLKLDAGKKMSDAKSLVRSDGQFYANLVVDANTNSPEVQNANRTALLYRLDRDHVKSLRSIANSNFGSMSMVQRRKFSGVLDSDGKFVFTTATNEYFHNTGPSLIGWYILNGATRSFHAPSVASSSTTSLTIDLGSSAAGATVYIIADVLRNNLTEKQKTLTNLTISKPAIDSGAIDNIVNLGIVDAFRLHSVKLFVEGEPDTVVADITDEFKLVRGITDTAYTESTLVRVKDPSVSLNSTHRIAVNIDYFQHSGNQGFYTIDSYAAALNAADTGLTYETLGEYISGSKDVYPIAATIDFRPDVIEGSPLVSYLPANDSTAVFDIQYYLPRADLLQINKDGALYIKKGTPSESPRIPRTDANAMALYEIWLNPYTYSLKDVSTKYIDNRRYTMRDIGSIDKRLQNVEYITALSLLEKSAAEMSIKDENGLDRYKNGFIADNFSNFQAADLTNIEFKASADRSQKQLRPSFKSSNKKLILNEAKSSGVFLRGKVACRPYTEKVTIEQPYATKHLSVNPYLQYNQKGDMVLSPNVDTWTDTRNAPAVVIDIDAGVDQFTELADAAGILGTDWGSWVDQNRTILGEATTSDVVVSGNTTTTTTTTTTQTQVNQVRTGTKTTVESRTDRYTIDDVVKDVQIIPFSRARTVQFSATKMKPNTKVYAFFDGQPVSEFCRDIGFQLTAANSATASGLVQYGSQLVTDANGELRGVFNIPGGRFFTGEKLFILTDDPEMSGDEDMQTTYAQAAYFSGGIDVTKQSVSMNVITPTFNTSQVSETGSIVESSSSSSTRVDVQPEPTPPPAPVDECSSNIQPWRQMDCLCATGRSWMCADPVAQGFISDTETFVTSLDLFFKQVDMFSDRIFVEIRNMVNGFPGSTVLGVKNYTPDQIEPFISDDSTRAFRVNFDSPIFLEANTQYCFVVGGASPNTRLWVARLGQTVVDMPGKIVEVPATSQVSFRSLNGTTWNAEQYEQIKFRIYSGVFSTEPMKLVFENSHEDDSWSLDENPFQMEVGQTRIRVFHKDHGFTAGDRVSISLFDDVPFLVKMTDFVPQIGQTIHTPTGSAEITDVRATDVGKQYQLKVKNMSGVFLANQVYICDAKQNTIADPSLITSMGSKKPESYTMNQCYGTIVENIYDHRFTNGLIGGVPVVELNTEFVSGSLGLSIVEVDSQDTYIINVQTPATATGRFGGTGINVYNGNEKYDLFNVSGAYMPYRSSENWTLVGLGHGDIGSLFESSNYQYQNAIQFKTQEDRFLGQPYKVASKSNEKIMLGAGKRSIEVTVTFDAAGDTTTPVVNTDSFSITTISNRCEWSNPEALQKAPIGERTWVPEEDPIFGTESYKYVTRNVNLANPATDIHIYLDVYRDLNADFDVYVKRLTPYDQGSIDDQPWMKVTGLQKNRTSVDLDDLIEYHIVASEHIVPYTSEGVSYPGWLDDEGNPTPFSSFRVKLVGKSKNSAKAPLFESLRIIAVT